MNQVVLIGNLTKDPELKNTGSGTAVCNFTLAVTRKRPNQAGEKVTDYFNVIAWKTLGEVCAKYLAKGRKVAITGELQTRSYEKDGVKRTVTEIVASDVEFLTPKGEVKDAPEAAGFAEIQDDGELPF